MPKAYWIARVDVHDPETYKSYVETAKPAFERFGGKFLARGGKTETLEGTSYARNVLVEFESLEKAVACYNSPEYAEALKHAKPSATRDIIVVEGV